MKQTILLLVFVIVSWETFGQTDRRNQPIGGQQVPAEQEDSDQSEEDDVETAPISLYKIISIENDTTSVDTTLNIYKDYRFNYLREDNFGLLPFSNVGQTYNRLAYNFDEQDHVMPRFGARARHFNFMEVEDINYYYVPTPFTELFFRTVFEQGQTTDALFTINTSENFNFSLAYKGLRSLGKYRHILASTGNFRATINYTSPNNRYHARAHFVSQDLLNEENGGLTETSLEQYISKHPEFDDRSRLDVNFENAQSTLFGKRFYLDHKYNLFEADNRILDVGHRLDVSDKEYLYEQTAASPFFGPSFENVQVRDETSLDIFYNEAFVDFSTPTLGKIRAKLGHHHYNYGYNSVLSLEEGLIENRLIGDNFSVGGAYSNRIGNFDFNANGELNILGEFGGYDLAAEIGYSLTEDILAFASAEINGHAPNFNFLLYQSDYINYNWQNDFELEERQSLKFRFLAPKLLNLNLNFDRISHYSYFGINDEGFVKPFQANSEVNYFKAVGHREFRLGKFALNNTLMYQNVLDGQDYLNVPTFVTRNTLYYSDHWFKRALFLQTGFTLNYFTDYYMNAYDPVLAEFYVQNSTEIEGFPTVDFFFNGKIRQARIFFKLEHVNALLDGNNNFAAPLYPYRDFAVRFGLVWNFFM